MDLELVENTASLASRVTNLAIKATGDHCRQLLIEQDRLIKLDMVAIVKDLNSEKPAYKKALAGLKKAIKAVDEADKDISKVADAIKQIKKAVDLVAKVVASAVTVSA